MTENRLLIVDDEPAIGSLVSSTADALGYHVLVVDTADAFLEQQRTWQPTHIVMDLHLPDMSGPDLLSHLASDTCSAKIFGISSVDRAIVEAAKRIATERHLNFASAITKPVLEAQLRAILLAAKNEIPWLSAAALNTALELGELHLAYQPVEDCKSGAIIGLEALARWQHPERGEILPADFIPVAESSVFIDRLTHWVAETGCRQLHAWDEIGLHQDLSVNISSRNLHDDGFAETLLGHCEASDIDPRRLTLELTEATSMRDAVQVLDTLRRIRDKGFKLAMDDFGTGYASLAEFHRLPFSEIKIDRTFLRDCDVMDDSRSIVRLVIELAHAMKLIVVAEGVETEAVHDLLCQMGCDKIQGYLISRPISPALVPAFVAQHQVSRSGA